MDRGRQGLDPCLHLSRSLDLLHPSLSSAPLSSRPSASHGPSATEATALGGNTTRNLRFRLFVCNLRNAMTLMKERVAITRPFPHPRGVLVMSRRHRADILYAHLHTALLIILARSPRQTAQSQQCCGERPVRQNKKRTPSDKRPFFGGVFRAAYLALWLVTSCQSLRLCSVPSRS